MRIKSLKNVKLKNVHFAKVTNSKMTYVTLMFLNIAKYTFFDK